MGHPVEGVMRGMCNASARRTRILSSGIRTESVYPVCMNRQGFTLLELLLVIGMLAVIGAIASPAWRAYQVRSDVETAVDSLTQALGRAKLKAVAGDGASAWGYDVQTSTLFRGTEFASRDVAADELYPRPSAVAASGLMRVTFAALTGRPSATGSIILTSIRGDVRQVSIEIDEEGIIVNRDDKLTICHCPSNPPSILRIPDAAWPAHRQHGDALGACKVPPQC